MANSADQLRMLGEICSGYMNRVRKCFRSHVEVTLIVRQPGNPEGDVLMSNDDFQELRALLDRCERRDPTFRERI